MLGLQNMTNDQVVNQLLSLSALVLTEEDEGKIIELNELMGTYERIAKDRGLDPFLFKVQPFEEILTDNNLKEIVEAHRSGNMQRMREAIRKITLALKRRIEAQSWDGNNASMLMLTHIPHDKYKEIRFIVDHEIYNYEEHISENSIFRVLNIKYSASPEEENPTGFDYFYAAAAVEHEVNKVISKLKSKYNIRIKLSTSVMT